MRWMILSLLCAGTAACATAPSSKGSAYATGAARNQPSQELQRGSAGTQETLTPYSDLMEYPANWVEITRKRE